MADAAKRLGRSTGEGLIGIRHDNEKNVITMIELNCETDFVAKTE